MLKPRYRSHRRLVLLLLIGTVNSERSWSQVIRIRRGGASNPLSDEDKELDAFIEELIATVDDDDEVLTVETTSPNEEIVEGKDDTAPALIAEKKTDETERWEGFQGKSWFVRPELRAKWEEEHKEEIEEILSQDEAEMEEKQGEEEEEEEIGEGEAGESDEERWEGYSARSWFVSPELRTKWEEEHKEEIDEILRQSEEEPVADEEEEPEEPQNLVGDDSDETTELSSSQADEAETMKEHEEELVEEIDVIISTSSHEEDGEEPTADITTADSELYEENTQMSKTESIPSQEKQRTGEKGETISAAAKSEASQPPSIRRRPPNAMYRFLLRQGRIGHIVTMISICIVEFFQNYFPDVAQLLTAMFGAILGSPNNRELEYVEDVSQVKTVNEQYTGFVAKDGTSIRGKRRKIAVKKADEKAAEQLRRLGSVRNAKYRHVSEAFMRRHRLGPYANSEPADKSAVVSTDDDAFVQTASIEDEDVDWVVQALTKDDKPTKKKRKRRHPSASIDPEVSFDLGSDGSASMSVGIEVRLDSKSSSRKKKNKKKNSIIEAATATTSSRKRPVVPRASDRDGGGGVVGRIRDFSANNLISRSLMGAYPGDALPPSEAASPEGLMDLAGKYGYGEWSDFDDEEEGGDSFNVTPNKKKKKKKKKVKRTTTSGSSLSRKKKKKRKKATSGITFEIGLSASSSGSSTGKPPLSTRKSKKASVSRTRPQVKTIGKASSARRETLLSSEEVLSPSIPARRKEDKEKAPVRPVKQRSTREARNAVLKSLLDQKE